MNPMIERLESITARYEELGQLLLEPATLSDNRLMAKLAKEQASLTQTDRKSTRLNSSHQ